MVKDIIANGKYLNFKVSAGNEKKRMSIEKIGTENGQPEKVMEFMVPDTTEDEAAITYTTQIPIEEYAGSVLRIQGDLSETFFDHISVGNTFNQRSETEKRPLIHCAADTGWTNDPNGMIFADGIYHLYYQYNPFELEWGNMSWGHAISRDLLHWEQKAPVMFPDKDGMIFSGCALDNKKKLLGLPEDALLFFYTAAGGSDEWSQGKEFIQKMAYSLDGGDTLTRVEEPCVPVLYKDSRDPKIFWHEETKAYIMVLWTKDYDFGILRSTDLKNWKLMEEITLEDGWECPDLFRLRAENGEERWFFWAADGYYYTGTFDGSHFETDGKKHHAYLTRIPYAAQTYCGTGDKVISIPWLRLKNDGRCYTSAYGLPVEFFCKKTEEGWRLMQKPVEQLWTQAVNCTGDYSADQENTISFTEKNSAVLIQAEIKDTAEKLTCEMNGSTIQYEPSNGKLIIDEQEYQVCENQRKLLFVLDDSILELFFEEEGQLGTFELMKNKIEVNMSTSEMAAWEIYKIK